ncbi:MAG: SHOCT domain-containing protein [Planctomycetota bacterium]
MRFSAPLKSTKLLAVLTAVALLTRGGETWAQSQLPGGVGGGNPMAENTSQVLFWCAVLLATAFIMGVAFFWLRKRLAAMDDDSSTAVNPLGFTLSDLRQMHDAGQISDEEFDFAKRKMIAKTKAKLESDNAPGDDEPEVEDLGDLTEATSTPQDATETDGSAESPDKDGPASGTSDDRPADKNDGPDDPPPPPEDPPSPPKPPKHW